MKIRKNDTVVIMAGKDKGRSGKVLAVYPDKNRLLVEGANIIKRHVKASPTIRQAGIIQRPGPLSAANVALVCTKCNKPTRVGYEVLDVREGEQTRKQKARVCKRCKQQIE